MKSWELEQAQNQIFKLRRSLKDDLSPPGEIKRPRYASGRILGIKRFQNRITKLKMLEKRVDKLVSEECIKWYKRVYHV